MERILFPCLLWKRETEREEERASCNKIGGKNEGEEEENWRGERGGVALLLN
jgi:hypothetical protein